MANLWLLKAGAGMTSFAVVFAAEGLLVAAAMTWVWLRWAPVEYRGWSFNFSVARELLAEGFPMYVATVYSQVYYRSDEILVERLVGASEAGLYTASARIYDIMIGVVPLITVSMFPTLSRWYSSNPEVFYERYSLLTRWISWAGLGVLAVVWVFRRRVVHIIFGDQYLPAIHILPWHLGTALLMYHSMLRSIFLTLCRRQSIMLWSSLIGMLVNLSMNLMLVPSLGANGAAIAGFFTQVATLVTSNALFSQTRWILRVSLETVLPWISHKHLARGDQPRA
jgi:PST family polysaccharide transporter